MPDKIVSAFIDQAEVRESKTKDKDILVLQVFAKVVISLKEDSPLLIELESSLGEKIDFTDEAQIVGLKGRDIRVHLSEKSTDLGNLMTIDDFRPILPISEKPDDTV